MARPSIKTFMDLSVPDNKRRLMAQLSTLTGLYEIDLAPRRDVRSNRQNRWYWSCLVSAFFQFLTEQDYDITDPEQAHEMLKARFLAVTIRHTRTGEVLGRRVRSTTELDTKEFADYCERIRTWLADMFSIVVPDPGDYTSTGAA